jgi:hypothetical protein
MSLVAGKRIRSTRKRVLAYCEQHKITVPKAFHDLQPVYAIALIDIRSSDRPRLFSKTFFSTKSALECLKQENRHPENYRFLDFKRGIEFVLEGAAKLQRGPGFDHRKDVDVVLG